APAGGPADGPASRVEQPQPPPIDRRGGSALAFGVLKRDRAAASLSETELAVLEGDADAGPPPDEASDEFPARPHPVPIDGGPGPPRGPPAVLDAVRITP